MLVWKLRKKPRSKKPRCEMMHAGLHLGVEVDSTAKSAETCCVGIRYEAASSTFSRLVFLWDDLAVTRERSTLLFLTPRSVQQGDIQHTAVSLETSRATLEE